MQSIFGAASATLAYARKGHVQLHEQLPMALMAVMGGSIGAALATIVPGQVLQAIMPVLLLAIAILVRLFQESVWRIAAAMLRDRDATENLVQQVFVDAYLHLDQYEPGTDFGAWIRTVARNRLRKDLRTASR